MPGTQSIDGLASSLDTTSIINAILEFERRPAVLMEERQAEKTDTISSVQAISAKLLALKTSITGLLNRSVFGARSVSVSDESVLSATANTSAAQGSYTVDVLSLAKNHQIASRGFSDASSAIFSSGSLSIAVGDRSAAEFAIDESTNSLTGLKNAINDADIGVTATIINDGSSSRPYRLVLTADEAGAANAITVSGSLSGSETIDFATTAFDDPEEVAMAATSTSGISLGMTAAYTGAVNKTYTFTVGGTGTQTVGDGNITIDWTDGTNSGSIVVSEADSEVELIGEGADGLKISLTDGALNSGDTFQVSTFAPLVQKATNARITIGSSADGASPLTITSPTNTITDVIPGLTLDLKSVTTGTGPVTIQTTQDTGAVEDKINSFIQAYNDSIAFIEEQSTYNKETDKAGILMGDVTVLSMSSRLKRMVTDTIPGLDESMNRLSAVGIRLGITGKLSLRDPDKLKTALQNDPDLVASLFAESAVSSQSKIEYVSSTTDTKAGSGYKIDITKVATKGYLRGATIQDPGSASLILDSSNNRLRLKIDGMVSDEIVLTSRTYTSGKDLAEEIGRKIAADPKVGGRGATVEWIDLGGEGYLEITSARYGSSSKIETVTSVPNNALALLGLATADVVRGEDVEGTINGEKATGNGQVLTGDAENKTTAGLKLRVLLTDSELKNGAEGTIDFVKGFASAFNETLDSYTRSTTGTLAKKTESLQKQVENIKDQIDRFDERLEIRKNYLYQKFIDLEQALDQFQSQGTYLETQLQNISQNFSQILKNGR